MHLSHLVRTGLQRLRDRDELGQTMVEYAMMLTLISATIVLSITSIGTTINGFMTSFTLGL